MTHDARRGRTMYQGARGAPATAHDGPLERVVRRHSVSLCEVAFFAWELFHSSRAMTMLTMAIATPTPILTRRVSLVPQR